MLYGGISGLLSPLLGLLFPLGLFLPPIVPVRTKSPELGIPTWQFDAAVAYILPEAQVDRRTGATPEDLKRAIAEGKIVIVAVGWETNKEILDKLRNGEQPLIGHYMVVVGYDSQQVYLLNPGETKALDKRTWEWFQKYWQRGNLFIESGSMWVLDRENKP